MTTELEASRRLKVDSQSAIITRAINGTVFTGSSLRPDVTVTEGVDTLSYGVIKTSSKWLIVNQVIYDIDFSAVTEGKFNHELRAYMDTSNGNTWSYTPNNPLPAGRSVNALDVNDFPLTTYDGQLPIPPTVTGNPDYNLFFTSYFVDTGGNRNFVSSTGTSFFEVTPLIIPPNTEALLEARSYGNASGSADIRATFFLTELTSKEIGL
jgi:hypothetical protein